MERVLVVGLDRPEYSELRQKVDAPIVATELLPRIKVEAGRLFVEKPGTSVGVFLPVSKVVFHGIFENDFDFITALALWGGPCLPDALGMMECRLRLPGLVHALRYCGLLDESMTAHDEARRLDPNVGTSLEGTLLMAGDLERLLAIEHTDLGGGDEGIRIMGLGLAGRRDDARELLVSLRDKLKIPALQAWTHYLLAWLERRPHDLRTHATEFSGLKIHDDPEAIFLQGWLACDAGASEMGLAYLQRAVAKGYSPVQTLTRAPQFDGMRASPEFASLLSDAEAGRRRALTAFREAGGQRLLGVRGPGL